MATLLQKKMQQKVVSFKYVNQNYFKVENTDRLFLDQLYDYFSVYVDAYMFMPQYQSGVWDGRIKYFDKLRQTIPIGLVQEAFRYISKFFKNKRVIIETNLKKSLYNRDFGDIKPEDFTLDRKPWEHQIKSIQKALFHRRAVIKSPTASGKSYIIACIMNYLYEKGEIGHWLLIVPTIQLVEQFRGDLIEYGVKEEKVGIIHGGVKDKIEEFSRPYVISTWQSLMQKVTRKSESLKWKKILTEYDGLIMDEVHLAQAKEIKNIVLHCVNTNYRLGFTGTLPDTEAELYGCLAYIGPKVIDIFTADLIKKGIVSDLKVCSIHLDYPNKDDYKELDWISVKQKVIKEKKRLALVKKICEDTQKNLLMLVSYVETEGKILERYLRQTLKEKEIVFIHGGVDVGTREEIRKSAENKNNMIIIATYGTFKMGINIKNLHRILFASPLKSKIANLQSIGRGLRVLPNKKLIVYDIVDGVKFLKSHGKARAKIWEKEKFQVKTYEI